MKKSNEEWGKLIHRTSKKWGNIRQILITSLGLFLAIIFSAGFWVGKPIIGTIGLIMVAISIFFILNLIRTYKDAHFDVYENGLWFPQPNYWLWQKRPPDERYFRSFDDIIDVEKKVTGSYHLFIHTKSEGKIQYAVYKKQGPELMDAIIEAMYEYKSDDESS
ncbi:MAG: hypothetical protein ACLFVB_07905 [Thermoplasmata archaeon]